MKRRKKKRVFKFQNNICEELDIGMKISVYFRTIIYQRNETPSMLRSWAVVRVTFPLDQIEFASHFVLPDTVNVKLAARNCAQSVQSLPT